MTATAASPSPLSPAELFARNTRLAWSLAHRFRRRGVAAGLAVEDLGQESLAGLWAAAKGFDPARGVRFATYAYYACLRRLLNACTAAERQYRHEHTGRDDVMEHVGAEAPDMTAAKDHVATLLRGLTARQRRVLQLRYGLGSGRVMTYREMAARLGVTHERCRQIVSCAVWRLRG